MEALVGELVIGERAAQTDVLRQIAARIGLQGPQQHAGQADSMGFRLKLLSMRNKDRRHFEAIAVLGNMVHGVGQEAARATRRVIQGTDQAGIRLEQSIVWVEQQGRG